MARKTSKIGSLLGMDSASRRRKSAAVDVAKQAGTKIPRLLFDIFGGSEITFLESAFSKWEDNRNKIAEARIRKKSVDQKYHKTSSVEKQTAADIVEEARKSREAATEAAQNQQAHQRKVDAYNSAMADQGSSQIKMLSSIRSELSEIKGILRLGNKEVGKGDASGGGQSGGGILSTLWNFLPGKWKGKIGGKAAEIAEKLGGKRLGSIVKGAAVVAGAEGLEHTAAEIAGSGVSAAAKSVVPEGAEVAAKAASGGLFGRIAGFGKSAINGAEGLIGSGKHAIGSLWSHTGGKLFGSAGKDAEKILGKVGGEEVEKVGTKIFAKEGLKAIPLLGNIIGLGTSLGFAGKRLFEGDLAGAAMETGSGLLNLIPGVGNYLSIAADLGIAARDIKRGNAARKIAQAAGKEVEGHGKTGKEISEEAAKIVEEKADPNGTGGEETPIQKAISAINPIGTAQADTISPGQIKSITPANAIHIANSSKATPMERLVAYMAGMYGLMSDSSKGIYIQQSHAPFQDSSQMKQAAAASKREATVPVATASTVQTLPDAIVTPPPGYTLPTQSSITASSDNTPSAPQAGAATNGGWHPGSGNGRLHFNVAGGSGSSSIGPASQMYGSVDGYDIDSMWDQLKGTIASGESGRAGYDAHNGGTIRGLTRMTIGQIKRMTGAMGKYQIIPGTTLREAARGVGLTDNDLFSPANQDAMGKWLFARRVKAGAKGGIAGIQSQLSKEWASLPNISGAGAWDGFNGNHAIGGAARGQSIASIISASRSSSIGSMSGIASTTANDIDSATQDVAKASSAPAPVVVAPVSGGGGGSVPKVSPGTGTGAAGPMVTRNNDSTVKSITQNFISGSSAMS